MMESHSRENGHNILKTASQEACKTFQITKEEYEEDVGGIMEGFLDESDDDPFCNSGFENEESKPKHSTDEKKIVCELQVKFC